MKRVYTVTPSEAEIIKASAGNPNIFADYWFRPEGMDHGWLFDNNFREGGRWQRDVHEAAQTDIMVIGGFGTGKTGGVGMSASIWSACTPNFKFLNIAEKAWQAKQMYDYILQTVQGAPFEKLIFEKPRRPFPAIFIKYKIGNILVESSMEFMSADKDATGILSWEGDWINVDEAGLLDNLEEIVTSVGSRLRGTVRGRERLGRLSLISNSWDNPYMWYLFDLAEESPEDYLSLVVSTRDNLNVTPKQFAKMLSRIPVDERSRFIEGTRPEGKGNYFAKQAVYECEDQFSGELAEKQALEGVPGWILYKMHSVGVYWYQEPPKRDRIYFLVGDPGTDKAPGRNAPVLAVFDATGFPENPARLIAFWWGDGGSQISPFVQKMVEWDAVYHPALKAVDATGPQKNTNEIINITYFADPNLSVQKRVIGMDFSGGMKMAYLIAARLFIEAKMFRWPKNIVGIRSQLTNYDPLKDKPGNPKIPQDIVSVMAMTSHLLRIYYNVDISSLAVQEFGEDESDTDEMGRLSSSSRERRSTNRERERTAQR